MSTGSSPAMADLGASSRARTRRGSTGGRARSSRPGGRGWIAHALVIAACLVLFGLGVLCGGFLVFASTVSALKPAVRAEADGIVVFTGGAERIAGALDLLEDRRARRLLISGVHPDTSARQIGRAADAGEDLLSCCVDLDRRAANTVGNAVETAKWVRRNAFRSLIVVTSAYHMPRSLTELGAAMPEVGLVPYPVSPATLDLDRWYLDRGTATLLLEEYLKYTASKARLALDGAGLGAPLPAGLR